LPTAAITLEAEGGLKPSGRAGVAFKPASGADFEALNRELGDLLQMSTKEFGSNLEVRQDSFGYRWTVLTDPDLDDLVTNVHLLNTTLEERGYGPQLLCSVFRFDADGGRHLDLIYLYKRGTFYPFAPLPGERRDNELELRIRGAIGSELPIEADLSRWFPLWGSPL
jgi:hypothetical protein